MSTIPLTTMGEVILSSPGARLKPSQLHDIAALATAAEEAYGNVDIAVFHDRGDVCVQLHGRGVDATEHRCCVTGRWADHVGRPEQWRAVRRPDGTAVAIVWEVTR